MIFKNKKCLVISAACTVAFVIIMLNVFDLPDFSTEKPYPVTVTHEAQTVLQEGKVNINTASLEELQTLYGIGEVRAKAIIEYREYNGRFVSEDELVVISGINRAIIDKNRGRLTF